MIIFLTSFTTAIVFIPFNAKAGAPPSCGVPSCGGWDTGNNCYAQYRDYEVTVTYSDADRWTDLSTVQLLLGQFGFPPETYVTFKYNPATRLFSAQVAGPVPTWDIDSAYATDVAEASPTINDLTITWKIKPQWDAEEVSNVDIRAYCEDTARTPASRDSSDVFDVVTTLLTDSLESQVSGVADDRVSVDSNIDLVFGIRYADDPASGNPDRDAYPPQTEFTSVQGYIVAEGGVPVGPISVGENQTIVNGNGTIASVTVPGDVNIYTYQLYVDMFDEDYSDAYLTNIEEDVITDQIIINWSSNQYSVDDGTGMTISLNDVIYDYDDQAVASYQYDYQIERAAETVDSYSGNTTASFGFTPRLTGYYYLNLTAFEDTGGGAYGIAAFQQNDTVLLTVKQNISVIKNADNNGVNYIAWGANASVSASTLASDLGLGGSDAIRKFNQSSIANPWSDIQYLVGPDAGDFTINRWDNIQIQVASSHSHSFTPDSDVDPSQIKTMNFSNSVLEGYNYVTWTNDFTITPADFVSDLGISGEHIELYVYDPDTNTGTNYNDAATDFATMTTINPYDVICFRAPGHSDINYDTDSIS